MTDLTFMENWLALRNAIILNAVEDYKMAFSDPEGKNGNMLNRNLRKECEGFFRGKWCKRLLDGTDENLSGREILKRVRDQTLQELKDGQEECEMKVKLVQETPDPVDLICQIASICYDSKIVNKKQFVRKLYRSGHHSVFEHVYFTFKIEGISRACSHQLVRHRMAAITQRSQRYCEENGFNYVTPPSIFFEEGDVMEKYKKQVEQINNTYCDMIHLDDIKKEDARYLLPNACETQMYFSCNLRELIHIANERLCNRAQWEIRKLVNMMCSQVDEDLRWMLVPKCRSGIQICYTPCEMTKKGYVILQEDKKKGFPAMTEDDPEETGDEVETEVTET